MTALRGRGLVAEGGRFIRANLSSGAASGIEWVLVTGLVHLVGLYYLYAAAAGAVTGAVTDFVLKRHWAFDRERKGAVEHEAARYIFVSAVSLALNLPCAYALVDGLRLPRVPGIILASLVVGFVWNYPLHRYYVFRQARHDPVASRRPADERA
jgi:putative flippase GtrA